MLLNKRILVVVPARGGSKGIKLKNLVPVNGVPLVALVGRLVRELDYVDRAVVSTDHPLIAEAAVQAGLEAPFYRPADLSGDLIGDTPVLQHALRACEELDRVCYDVVVMLQPTSPLRRAAHVSAAVLKVIENNYDAAWTVSRTDTKYHPLKQLAIDGDRLTYYDPAGAAVIARQQLTPLYHRNGAAYAVTRQCLLEQDTLMGACTAAVLIEEPMISIDTEEDCRLVESYLREAGRSTPKPQDC